MINKCIIVYFPFYFFISILSSVLSVCWFCFVWINIILFTFCLYLNTLLHSIFLSAIKPTQFHFRHAFFTCFLFCFVIQFRHSYRKVWVWDCVCVCLSKFLSSPVRLDQPCFHLLLFFSSLISVCSFCSVIVAVSLAVNLNILLFLCVSNTSSLQFSIFVFLFSLLFFVTVSVRDSYYLCFLACLFKSSRVVN